VSAGDPGAPGAGVVASAADRGWLARAIDLSRRCPPSQTAYAVGAIIVAADGAALAAGYSRETSPHDHAEEVALAKLGPAAPGLGSATLYSSLEPCRFRDRLAGAAGARRRGRGRQAPQGRRHRGGDPRPGRRGPRRQRRRPRRIAACDLGRALREISSDPRPQMG
jgi:hypothetical protein